MLKPYSSIKNYLERFSIVNIGKLKIRIHKILNADGTPYLHNHPFNYISIILKGNYTEQLLIHGKLIERKYKFGSIIIRNGCHYHRIKSANYCMTLFIAFYNKRKWSLIKHKEIDKKDFNRPQVSGIYLRNINNKLTYCKFNEFWFIGSHDIDKAINETRLSIYQVENWGELIHKI